MAAKPVPSAKRPVAAGIRVESRTAQPRTVQGQAQETIFEAVAGYCTVLVVGLFALTLLAQNYVIPSGSMENTLLIGDHLVVDRITFAPPSKWMPLAHQREPQRGDVVVFFRPAPRTEPDAEGNPFYDTLVKRLVGVPGDRVHLRDGVVFINGVAQNPPPDGKISPVQDQEYVDNFPALLPTPSDDHTAVEAWVVTLPGLVTDGDLVVPPGKYFMMGDNRHGSYDSRFWGLVPRENIIGRPLFNFWSFEMPEGEGDKTGIGNALAWVGHVALHFFTETRWSRTFHRIR
jgi:signal peptidase I